MDDMSKFAIVFMQYRKQADGSLKELSKPNVDFGGGLERLSDLRQLKTNSDVLKQTYFPQLLKAVEKQVDKSYKGNEQSMRIVTGHLISSSSFITSLHQVGHQNY